jgi:hypothetical protein
VKIFLRTTACPEPGFTIKPNPRAETGIHN